MKNLIFCSLFLLILGSCATPIKIDPKYGFDENITPLLNLTGLAPKQYKINNTRDTVIIGDKGTIINIPANSFKTTSGNEVDIELIEALTLGDIVTLGAQTVAGDNLLQTGGVLFLQAYENGQELALNTGSAIQVKVPTNQLKEGMQLYNGAFDENGAMDWELTGTMEVDSNMAFNQTMATGMVEIPFELFPYKEEYVKMDSIARENPMVMGVIKSRNISNLISPEAAKFYAMLLDIINSAKYQGTNLATREFAERLYRLVYLEHAYHFHEPDADGKFQFSRDDFAPFQYKALDIYIANINKPLWYSDSLVSVALAPFVPPYYGGRDDDWKKEYELHKANCERQKAYFTQFYKERLTYVTLIDAMGIDLSSANAVNELVAKGLTPQDATGRVRLFKQQQEVITALKKDKDAFIEQLKLDAQELQAFKKQNQVEYYLMQVRNLGWLNVDQIYDVENAQKIELAATVDAPKNLGRISVTLVFKGISSFISGYETGGGKYQITKEGGNKLPIGRQAVLLAIAEKDGEMYLGRRTITIGDNELETLTVSKISLESYKEIMEAL